MKKFKLNNYDIISNGADGGHIYLSSEIQYKGVNRKIIVLFESKKEENLILKEKEILVCGILEDDKTNPLILSSARIILE